MDILGFRNGGARPGGLLPMHVVRVRNAMASYYHTFLRVSAEGNLDTIRAAILV